MNTDLIIGLLGIALAIFIPAMSGVIGGLIFFRTMGTNVEKIFNLSQNIFDEIRELRTDIERGIPEHERKLS